MPALVSLPGGASGRSEAFVSVKDVAPTVLELAGIAPPGDRYDGRPVAPLEGRSMLPLLRGEAEAVHGDDHVMGWEIFGQRALRAGDWKIV